MGRLKKGTTFYLSILLVSVIMHGCCEYDLKIIGDGTLMVSPLNNDNRDTMNGEFRLLLDLDVQYADNSLSSGIINSANAFSCGYYYLNSIIPESIELKSNKSFRFKGEVISAGTNFLMENIMPVFMYEEESFFGQVEIHFTDEFLEDCEFQQDFHEFEISLKTDDEMEFSNKAITFLNLK